MKPKSAPEREPKNLSPLNSLWVFPGTKPSILKAVATRAHSLVLTTFALGSLPEDLLPTVREITDSGKPVFIIPDNSKNAHGVVRIVDQLQIDTRASGAIFLEKGGIQNEQEVYAAITAAVGEGLRGAELGETVRQHFAYGPGEQRPSSILDKPEEGTAALRKQFGDGLRDTTEH